MIDKKKFLGIHISDGDDYGTIHLRLAVNLLTSVRQRDSEQVIEEKACNIVKVCCEPMFDNLIEAYDWNPDEVDYAEEVLVQYMKFATNELLQKAKHRVKHTRKHERRTKLQIDDLTVAAIMAFVMTLPDRAADQLEDSFLKDHGAMYFSR
ncbi:MAG: hypothetical protein WDZ93_02025 [Candidatus Paceibacterota bacterium]